MVVRSSGSVDSLAGLGLNRCGWSPCHEACDGDDVEREAPVGFGARRSASKPGDLDELCLTSS